MSHIVWFVLDFELSRDVSALFGFLVLSFGLAVHDQNCFLVGMDWLLEPRVMLPVFLVCL